MRIRKASASVAAFVASIAAPLGCGPATKVTPVADPHIAPAASAKVRAMPPALSPARWSIFPTDTLHQSARLDLATIGVAGGGELSVGSDGDRWVAPADETKTPVVATTLAPEPLVGILASSASRFVFVGASGSTFVATSPLGPLTPLGKSTRKLRRVAVGKQALLATSADGHLLRSTDEGVTWTEVATPTTLRAHVPMEVAMLPTGVGVTLLFPQRALVTFDDGATWTIVPTLPLGARGLVADGNGDLVIEGLEASAILRTTPAAHFERIARPVRDGVDVSFPHDLIAPTFSDAVHAGLGALAGDRYVELVSDPEDGKRWRIAVGPLGEPLEFRRLPELDGCEGTWVGAQQDDAATLVVGCDRTVGPPPEPDSVGMMGGRRGYEYDGPTPPVPGNETKLFRSVDGGKTWKDDGAFGTVSRNGDTRRMWLSANGTLIVDGGCKRSHGPEWICSQSPPIVRPSGSHTFARVGGLRIGERLGALRFTSDGGKAYAITVADTGRASLLVSVDGGLDFTRHPLPNVLEGEGDEASTAIANGQSATIDIDPSGAVVIASALEYGSFAVFSTRDDGVTFETRKLPFEATDAAIGGGHVYAVDGEDASWESADTGRSWTKVVGPSRTIGSAKLQAECNAYGCVVASGISRTGWDTSGTGPVTSEKKDAPSTPRAGSTIECDVDGDRDWKALGNFTAPDITDADLGNGSRWLLARRDNAIGSTAAVVASNGPHGIETKEVPLLAAPKDPQMFASMVGMSSGGVPSIGYAIRRGDAVPTAPPPPTPTWRHRPPPPPPPTTTHRPITPQQIIDVDVAWYSATSDKAHHATIKAAGPLDPSKDLYEAGHDAVVAKPGLMTIGNGGITVRPFASPTSPIFFISDAGVVERLAMPEMPARDTHEAGLTLRTDVRRVDGHSIVFALAPREQLVVAAASPLEKDGSVATGGPRWTWGLWPNDDLPDETPTWSSVNYATYMGQPVAIVSSTGALGMPPFDIAVSMSAFGDEPTVIGRWPTQLDLGDPPRGCTDPKMASAGATRMLAPYDIGSRHPVLIHGADQGVTSIDGKELVMVTGRETLRFNGPMPSDGSLPNACVGAIEAIDTVASSTKGSPTFAIGGPTPHPRYVVLMTPSAMGPDAKGQATLFRRIESPSSLAYRTMTCRYSKAPMPASLAHYAGFTQ